MKINSAVSLELLSIMRHFTLGGLPAGFCTVEDIGAVPEDMLLAVLPEAEKARSNSFQIGEERRHFLFRRCFQQVFVAQQIGWQGEMNMLSLVHGQDRRPHCTDAPKLKLSFTSTGKTCLFGAAENADLGVDIERERNVLNASALAQRFFAAHEAHDVANCPAVEQSLYGERCRGRIEHFDLCEATRSMGHPAF
jgi:phosphopantetheinyl transferase